MYRNYGNPGVTSFKNDAISVCCNDGNLGVTSLTNDVVSSIATMLRQV